MNRRTLFKGLAALPLLKHLDLDLSTQVEEPSNHWTMRLAEEGLKTGDGREPCLSDVAYERLMASGGLCAPMSPVYNLQSSLSRPVRDSLPILRAPRGGIRFIKPE